MIGLQGSIFSTTPVNVTYPGDTGVQPKHKGLNQSAIIGIVVGVVVTVLILAALGLICYRKRRDRKLLKGLRSPLDPRFGAPNITAPNDGSYATPSTSPGYTIKPYHNSLLSSKEVDALSVMQGQQSPPGYTDAHSHRINTLPDYSPTQIPTHKAYIRNSRHSNAISLASTATRTENPYPPESYRSAESSPKNFPSPISTTISTPSTPKFELGLPPRPNSRLSSNKMSPKYSPPPLITPSSIYSHTSVSSAQGAAAALSQSGPGALAPIPQNIPLSAVRDDEMNLPTQPSDSSAKVGRSLSLKGIFHPRSSSSQNSPPLVISGPIVQADRRFEQHLGDRERWEMEAQQQNNARTPQSAESQPEQWPGAY